MEQEPEHKPAPSAPRRLRLWRWFVLTLAMSAIGLALLAWQGLRQSCNCIYSPEFATRVVEIRAQRASPEMERPYAVGETVTVYGTEGAGLRVRECSSSSCERIATSDEGAWLVITGGPVQGDNLIWYRVRTFDGTVGYVVEDYLRIRRTRH